jgi:hypothetical protein
MISRRCALSGKQHSCRQRDAIGDSPDLPGAQSFESAHRSRVSTRRYWWLRESPDPPGAQSFESAHRDRFAYVYS